MDHHHQQQHYHYLQQQQQQQVLHHHHQNQNQNLNSNSNTNQSQVGSMSMSVDVSDRFPQWSHQETKELLMIRAELDQTFMETKRNKPLWEVIATKMKEKGYNRSPDQCKCKWKNLVTRYKGCETIEAETVRQQFPFYNELQAIFTARMQRMLWAEAEGGGGGLGAGSSKKHKHSSTATILSSDDELFDDINEDFSEGEQKGNANAVITTNTTATTSSGGGGVRKKLKKMGSGGSSTTTSSNNVAMIREVLEDFMKQQAKMEAEWREAVEARERERRAKEEEWRQAMRALENERVAMERSWREREEMRRIREESRAEKRDALITLLLNKLRRDHDL